MKTVLIVDDSESIRAFLSYSLEKVNYKVFEAANGQEALKFFTDVKVHFDIVVTDLHMPIMDGLQFIKEVRKINQFKYLPILVLTTESGIEQKMQAKLAGATGWIIKPITSEKLLQVLNKCLR